MTAAAPLAALLQRAVALHRQGQLARARVMYEKILSVDPRHGDALHMLGVLSIQTKNPRVAVELIGKAIEAGADTAAAHCNLGSALEALTRWEAALASYDRALALQPGFGEAHFNRGNVLAELGRHDAALDSYARALVFKPGFADAYVNQGNVLRKLMKLEAARLSYDRAIDIAPHHAGAHAGRGLVLKDLGHLAEALSSYDRAIAAKPNHAQAHCNRGNVLKELRRCQDALASYDEAIRLKDDFAEAHFNRGVLLHDLGDFNEALASYDRALAIRPDYAEAHSNRGNALKELQRLPEAIASYGRAIGLRSDYAEAYFNRAIAHLIAGQFEPGWTDYEWRWKNTAGTVINERREFAQPLWRGTESLAGKSILLHGEQGLGDTLQFCRYARLVANRGARVILEVKAPLVPLLADLAGVSQVHTKGKLLPHVDYQCPLLSLPLAFGTRLDNIPFADGYVCADPRRIADWRTRLAGTSTPRIGLVWSGNPKQRSDAMRSIPLSLMLSSLPSTFQYICLQTEVRECDRRTLRENPDVLDFGSALTFENAAALCDCLDLLISVDTSLAHLGGALGKKTWILLPFNPDWRWLLDRPDSPWYRSLTLFRQTTRGDWHEVFTRVNEDLTRLFNHWSPSIAWDTHA